MLQRDRRFNGRAMQEGGTPDEPEGVMGPDAHDLANGSPPTGVVPDVGRGGDRVHAILSRHEVVFTPQQLLGIEIKNPKLLRKDQVRAIVKAHSGAARAARSIRPASTGHGPDPGVEPPPAPVFPATLP